MPTRNEDTLLIAAVEGGGTSFRVAICQVPASYHEITATPFSTILYRTEVDSSHNKPQETLAACADFLKRHKPAEGYHALGIASFGPLGVRPEDPETYGCILESSPKAAWRNVDLLTPLREACERKSRPLAVRVETDVNAPALAEYRQAQNDTPNISSTAYVTVGTGVGVGLVVNGSPVHGRMHPEGGHVPVQPLDGDTFGGYSWGDKSPFHGKNTVEGLASSVALTERLEKLQAEGWQQLSRTVLATLPDDHDVWKHAANALANLCVSLLLTLSVEKIVLGGGIMKRDGLLEKIQAKTLELLNGYLPMPEDNMSTLITTSKAGHDAGLIGAIVLAERALLEDIISPTKEHEKEIKQIAYGHGLWHGFIVGVVSTALVCKYLIRSR